MLGQASSADAHTIACATRKKRAQESTTYKSSNMRFLSVRSAVQARTSEVVISLLPRRYLIDTMLPDHMRARL
jgi:hypothetical protein